MLSSASKNAIILLQYLAGADPEIYHAVADIAAETDSPSPYLSKLVKELSWLGIIESKRGVGGGIRLSRKGKTISMFEVCKEMKDPLVKRECVLRNLPCDPSNPCAFHTKYKQTRDNLLSYLKKTKATKV